MKHFNPVEYERIFKLVCELAESPSNANSYCHYGICSQEECVRCSKILEARDVVRMMLEKEDSKSSS